MNTCHVVAAGENSPALLPQREEGDLIIAADGGLSFLRDNGVEPDLFVGDGDSLGFLPDDLPAVILPTVKDDTDTQAALRAGLERGYRSFILYGALGGRRISHALSNVQNLSFLAENGAKGVILDEGARLELLDAGETVFEQEGGYFSLFALFGDARVAIRGARYEGAQIRLTPASSLGVSNEPRGKTRVTLLSGTVLLVREP